MLPGTLFMASLWPQAYLAWTRHFTSLLSFQRVLLRKTKSAELKQAVGQGLCRKDAPVSLRALEPERFEDRYENAGVEMIQRKRAGMPTATERIAAPRRMLPALWTR